MSAMESTDTAAPDVTAISSNNISRERLDIAAIAVHRVLAEHRMDHAFFGGYQLVIMGCPRGTKDVDVVVKKPFINGFQKIKDAFTNDSEFRVIDGLRVDAIRAIHFPSRVGVDIMLQDLPKPFLRLPNDSNQLPFCNASHVFVKKIECLGVRMKENDVTDLEFLFNDYKTSLDFAKIKKKVTKSHREEALTRHNDDTRVVNLLESLDGL